MKTLEQLNNVERGKLLFDLFPQMIPDLITYTQNLTVTIREEQEIHRSQWQNVLMTFDFWLSIAAAIEAAIIKYDKQLTKRSRLFADQLFDGSNALFMAHALYLYTTIRKCENEKFTTAVRLLFNE